jgi:hypothetical protein
MWTRDTRHAMGIDRPLEIVHTTRYRNDRNFGFDATAKGVEIENRSGLNIVTADVLSWSASRLLDGHKLS